MIGKQWMWKAQQPNGMREINELHVPVGRNIRLILASEDVIHDFFVPAFRVKMDVVPGHYNTMCSVPRSRPLPLLLFAVLRHQPRADGRLVTVMEPSDYAAWLSGSSGGSVNPVVAGESSLPIRLAPLVMSPMAPAARPRSMAFLAQKFF